MIIHSTAYTYPPEILDLGDGTYQELIGPVTEVTVEVEGQELTEYHYNVEIKKHAAGPITEVPFEVAAWRLRAVTRLAGMEAAIATFLDSIPDPAGSIAREAWFNGTTIERQSATISEFGTAMDLTSEDLDNLFIQAASIIL